MLSDADFNCIARSLSPHAKRQVNQSMVRFLRTCPRAGTAEQIVEAARATLKPIFPAASPRERTTLAFYMIGKLLGRHDHSQKPSARGDTALKARIKWKSILEQKREEADPLLRESLSEMGEMDILMLQWLMERKAQLERMISDVMKKGHVSGQNAVQALKSS